MKEMDFMGQIELHKAALEVKDSLLKIQAELHQQPMDNRLFI